MAATNHFTARNGARLQYTDQSHPVHSRPAPVTFLCAKLVNPSELLRRLGDERSHHAMQAQMKLLREAMEAHGGREVKWHGDGAMAAFVSTAAAVRCATAVQQAARRRIDGERLEARTGLAAGEVPDGEEALSFGSPLHVAGQLCDRAEGGQILCHSVIPTLLSGRQAFEFRQLGDLELKGVPEPVRTCELMYEPEETAPALSSMPFVGRAGEMSRLREGLAQAQAGRGALLMLVGEPGIGKTRLAEEFTARARAEGVTVLRGRCYEGEWAPPYGPFAEAIGEYVRDALPEDLRADLGYGAGPIARLVPALRGKLPDIEEPTPLQPDEERFRLLDAVSQFLVAISQRAPVVLVLDDLHWADKGTVTMLRHVARLSASSPTLLLGAYRDVELDPEGPLADALAALRVETNFERLLLEGLDASEVGRLIAMIAGQDVPEPLTQAISAETDGNPFFIREVLLDLVGRGAIQRREGRWISDASSIEELGIPEGVRQVVGRRLSRVSEAANRLLTAACAFNGGFHFGIAARVVGVDEARALDAIDEALEAQLIRPAGDAESFDFVHANIRHTLYSELSPPRQVRLHRKVAEAMEEVYGTAANEHAAEIAYQYHRSATLPGAQRGIEHAIAAADKAEASYAHDDAASFLRMTLGLLPDGDERRPRLFGRLGLALAWALDFDEALKVARQAGDLIAAAEGSDAGADYLAEAARTMHWAGSLSAACALAGQGLHYAGGRRDVTWAWLMDFELVRRQAEDPDDPGVGLDGPERRQAAKIVRHLPFAERPPVAGWVFDSREDVLLHPREEPLYFWIVGDYRKALQLCRAWAEEGERTGLLVAAVKHWAGTASCHIALGEFAAAREAYDRAAALFRRLAGSSWPGQDLGEPRAEMRLALGEGEEKTLAEIETLLGQPVAELYGGLAPLRASAAALYARLGQDSEALHWLRTVIPAVERGAGWADYYNVTVGQAVLTLWLLWRTDHIEVIERNLREKVIKLDFRHPSHDGRLSLARLCALQGRHDEAVEWFARSRAVLDDQGARPLRAIVDYDEALMYARRGRRGDRGRAAALVEAALSQFQELGMTGWVRRAEELRRQVAGGASGTPVLPDGLTPREAEVLRLIAAGRTNTEIANDLTLSVRTVARHITNIYGKIGARNRAEAATYASRHSLI